MKKERHAEGATLITRSPFALVVVIAVAAMASEVLIMFLLPFFISPDNVYKAVADGFLLVLFLMPVLYYFIYRPFRRQLREAEEKFHVITRSAVDAVISINGAGEIIGWNKAAEKMFGYAEDEALGKPVGLVIPKRYDEAHRQGLARVAAGGPYRLVGKTVTIEGLRKDGTEFPLDLSLSAWNSEGKTYFTGIIRDITERKKVEDVLRESHENLRQVMENSPVPMALTDEKWRIVFLNRKFIKKFGYDLTDIPAMEKWWLRAYPDPSYREEVKADWNRRVEAVMREGVDFFPIETVIVCKDGSRRDVTFNFSFIGNRGLTIYHDITERKAAEVKLKASESALAKAQELVHLGNWELDFQTGKTIWSAELRRIYGLPAEETEPTFERFIALVHPKDRTMIEENMQMIKSGELPRTGFEIRIIRPDGEERAILGKLEVINGTDGKPAKLIGINLDITDRKLTEQTLLRSKKLASIGILSTGLAHEILNPLNIIGTTAQLLMLEEPQGEIYEKMQSIMAQIQRAVTIVKNLSTFARQNRVEREEIHLSSCFDQAVGLMEAELTANNIKIERYFAHNVPSIKGDVYLLMQVASILIGNARDSIATRGHGTIMVETRPVEGGVECKLCDDGPGIPAALLEKVFDPFFTTKDPGKGTGLGLSMAHRIIEDHGGTISVSSEAGKGACFTVFLPKDNSPAPSRNT